MPLTTTARHLLLNPNAISVVTNTLATPYLLCDGFNESLAVIALPCSEQLIPTQTSRENLQTKAAARFRHRAHEIATSSGAPAAPALGTGGEPGLARGSRTRPGWGWLRTWTRATPAPAAVAPKSLFATPSRLVGGTLDKPPYACVCLSPVPGQSPGRRTYVQSTAYSTRRMHAARRDMYITGPCPRQKPLCLSTTGQHTRQPRPRPRPVRAHARHVLQARRRRGRGPRRHHCPG